MPAERGVTGQRSTNHQSPACTVLNPFTWDLTASRHRIMKRSEVSMKWTRCNVKRMLCAGDRGD